MTIGRSRAQRTHFAPFRAQSIWTFIDISGQRPTWRTILRFSGSSTTSARICASVPRPKALQLPARLMPDTCRRVVQMDAPGPAAAYPPEEKKSGLPRRIRRRRRSRDPPRISTLSPTVRMMIIHTVNTGIPPRFAGYPRPRTVESGSLTPLALSPVAGPASSRPAPLP